MDRVPPPSYPSEPPLGPPLPPVPPGSVRSPFPWGPPPEPPAPPPRRTGLVVGAVLAALALVAAAVFVVARRGDDERAHDRRPAPSTTTTTEADEASTTTTEADDEGGATTTTDVPTEEEFDAVVADIERFVEQERGLDFVTSPEIELLDDDEFERALLDTFDAEVEADLVAAGHTLEAIGLLEPDFDVVDAYRTLLTTQVLGFYDQRTGRLVVRGTSTSPFTRAVLAHELTHALDDQHFELSRPELDTADDERSAGFTALVEGNASHVEAAYRATFTEEEAAEASDEELTASFDPAIFELPLTLLESLQAPYLYGPDLIDAILDAGGQARLDAAFDAPPTTSEQFIEPDAYLAGEPAAAVAEPTADGEVVDRGALGALGLAQLLGVGPLLAPGELDPAVEGWGGDRYVTWEDPGGRSCLRLEIVGDTPADTAEIFDALEHWILNPPLFSTAVHASVVPAPDGEPMTLTSCSVS